jgi:alkylhydroperoxidase family enzyme
MHTQDARANGESEKRLYTLDALREPPFFSGQERAALAWTGAVTDVPDGHVAAGVYKMARVPLTDKELVAPMLAVVAINGWNTLAIGFRTVSATNQPRMSKLGTIGRVYRE